MPAFVMSTVFFPRGSGINFVGGWLRSCCLLVSCCETRLGGPRRDCLKHLRQSAPAVPAWCISQRGRQWFAKWGRPIVELGSRWPAAGFGLGASKSNGITRIAASLPPTHTRLVFCLAGQLTIFHPDRTRRLELNDASTRLPLNRRATWQIRWFLDKPGCRPPSLKACLDPAPVGKKVQGTQVWKIGGSPDWTDALRTPCGTAAPALILLLGNSIPRSRVLARPWQ